MKTDIFETITNNMIEAMESATGDFKMPWGANPTIPTNLQSKKNYRGVNVLQLWISGAIQGFTSPYWMTFNQGKELGGMVRKGQKATPIVFWKMVKIKDDKTGEDKTLPMARSYYVFNAEQFDGIEIPEPQKFENETIDEIEELISLNNIDIQHGGESAAYNFAKDQILMPNLERFHSTEGYYETLLHEMTHWTGHASRCDRKLCGQFGSEDYAYEELVAELGSAFLCANFGITNNLQHPEYLKSWIAVLKNDKSALRKAAQHAQLAFDYVVGTEFEAAEKVA